MSVRLTVSPLISSTTSSSTSLSASILIDQFALPSGVSEQASAMRKASWRPSSLRAAPGLGLSESAASSPSSTKRFLTRSTVVTAEPRKEAISLSMRPSSASSSIRARRILRALLFPLVVNCSNSFLSCSSRSTMYFFTVFSFLVRLGRRLPTLFTVEMY